MIRRVGMAAAGSVVPLPEGCSRIADGPATSSGSDNVDPWRAITDSFPWDK
jgi:hypothetical protein